MTDCTLSIVVSLDVKALSESKAYPGIERVSLGKVISKQLLTWEDEVKSPQHIKNYLDDFLRGKSPGPVVCTDIDLLFDPSFHLDPLIIFMQISRFTSLIVLWPGDYKEGILSYAEPQHKHYRFWKNQEGIDIKGVSDAIQ